MSLPLKRRIAQAALVVAAGATPLVAAGSASATQLVPQGTDLGAGVTKLADVPDSASTVQGAAHNLGQAAGATGATTVATGVPAAADATGATLSSALPNADQALGRLTGPAAKTTAVTGALGTIAERVAPALADKVNPAVTDKILPAATQTRSAGVSPLGGLPGPVAGLANGLPTSALGPVTGPVSGVTKTIPGADALSSLTGHEAAASDRLGGVPPLGALPTGNLTHALPTGALPTGALGPVGSLLGGIG